MVNKCGISCWRRYIQRGVTNQLVGALLGVALDRIGYARLHGKADLGYDSWCMSHIRILHMTHSCESWGIYDWYVVVSLMIYKAYRISHMTHSCESYWLGVVGRSLYKAKVLDCWLGSSRNHLGYFLSIRSNQKTYFAPPNLFSARATPRLVLRESHPS